MIEENSAWWGEGFTEWNNVKSASPQFPGHYQPHVPHRSIGYYDLLDKNFLKKQHALASKYGLYGFCYYYYYFNGRTLLDAPLKIVLKSRDIDVDFCLCWANGSWTRAWYGQNTEVLISNQYTLENAAGFMKSIIPYLNDDRYIRIEGKPLLLVYQPEDIPTCKEYSRVWRKIAVEHGLEGLYLTSVEALIFGVSPEEYGFDAAVEFAPDWTTTHLLSKIGEPQRIFDYVETVKNMLLKQDLGYERYPCVFPGWDNAPRYKKAAVTFVNAKPGTFKYFLETTVKKCALKFPPEKRFIFINAWNEWGEGCHLEPDERHGYAYLHILRQVLEECSQV